MKPSRVGLLGILTVLVALPRNLTIDLSTARCAPGIHSCIHTTLQAERTLVDGAAVALASNVRAARTTCTHTICIVVLVLTLVALSTENHRVYVSVLLLTSFLLATVVLLSEEDLWGSGEV